MITVFALALAAALCTLGAVLLARAPASLREEARHVHS